MSAFNSLRSWKSCFWLSNINKFIQWGTNQVVLLYRPTQTIYWAAILVNTTTLYTQIKRSWRQFFGQWRIWKSFWSCRWTVINLAWRKNFVGGPQKWQKFCESISYKILKSRTTYNKEYHEECKWPRCGICKLSSACVIWHFWSQIHIQHQNFSPITNFRDFIACDSNFMKIMNLALSDYTSSYKDLQLNAKSTTIHIHSIRLLALEIYKTLHNLHNSPKTP